MPEEMRLCILQKIYHCSLEHPENAGFDIRIRDANSKTVTKCKACQLTNTVANEKNPGNKFRGTKPRVYWETDFTEVKQEKLRQIFTDVYRYFLGLTEAFLTKHTTTFMVTKQLLKDILPR